MANLRTSWATQDTYLKENILEILIQYLNKETEIPVDSQFSL